MISEPIFKRDSHGNIRVWQYEVEGNAYRTISGIKNGTMVQSGWTVCTAKSKATDEEQALFEADALERHKLARTYHSSERNVDSTLMFEPMLAKEFGREKKRVVGRVLSQPKLDGIRCVATIRGLFTRQGKAITAVPHIEEYLEEFFVANPDVILDGELYNHKLKDDFNTIASVVRRAKNTDADIEKARELIEYHIYDTYDDASDWEERMVISINGLTKEGPIHFVKTDVVDMDVAAEELDRLYAEYVADGYEGQMIRLPGVYENKRSTKLLKRKEFMTEEFEVVDIFPGLGNWAGCAKTVVLKLPTGRTFGSGIRGTQSDLAKVLAEKEKYLGGTATNRFFAYTPDGVPRFPVVIDLQPNGRVD